MLLAAQEDRLDHKICRAPQDTLWYKHLLLCQHSLPVLGISCQPLASHPPHPTLSWLCGVKPSAPQLRRFNSNTSTSRDTHADLSCTLSDGHPPCPSLHLTPWPRERRLKKRKNFTSQRERQNYPSERFRCHFVSNSNLDVTPNRQAALLLTSPSTLKM